MRALLIGALLSLSPTPAAATTQETSDTRMRFVITSAALERIPAPLANDRFGIQALLQRSARQHPLEGAGMLLHATLEKAGTGTCVIPTLLFHDGFEAQP